MISNVAAPNDVKRSASTQLPILSGHITNFDPHTVDLGKGSEMSPPNSRSKAMFSRKCVLRLAILASLANRIQLSLLVPIRMCVFSPLKGLGGRGAALGTFLLGHEFLRKPRRVD